MCVKVDESKDERVSGEGWMESRLASMCGSGWEWMSVSGCVRVDEKVSESG